MIIMADGGVYIAGDLKVAGQLTPGSLASLNMPSAGVPASAAAAGTTGQIVWANGFIYVCVATNTWQRVAIATW